MKQFRSRSKWRTERVASLGNFTGYIRFLNDALLASPGFIATCANSRRIGMTKPSCELYPTWQRMPSALGGCDGNKT